MYSQDLQSTANQPLLLGRNYNPNLAEKRGSKIHIDQLQLFFVEKSYGTKPVRVEGQVDENRSRTTIIDDKKRVDKAKTKRQPFEVRFVFCKCYEVHCFLQAINIRSALILGRSMICGWRQLHLGFYVLWSVHLVITVRMNIVYKY